MTIKLEDRYYSLMELADVVHVELLKNTFTEVEFECTQKTFDYIQEDAISFQTPHFQCGKGHTLNKIVFVNGITGTFKIIDSKE